MEHWIYLKVSNPPANFVYLLLNLNKNNFTNKLNYFLKTDISIKKKKKKEAFILTFSLICHYGHVSFRMVRVDLH